MRCARCIKNAVYSDPALCKKHFVVSIEETVENTIKKYELIKKRDHIVVAVSGGKDSITLLYILNKLKQKLSFTLTALAIDEGIVGYRDKTLVTVTNFCKQYDIALQIVSYKDSFGKSLDQFLTTTHKNTKPCTLCGAFRRTLLNKYARIYSASKLATGHNLDDESQAILMNLLRGTPQASARLGPQTGVIEDNMFIPRIKPLYFIPEKQIAAYSFMVGFNIEYGECPYAVQAYRGIVGELLNGYEQKHRGAKKNMINLFLKNKKRLMKLSMEQEEKVNYCSRCKEPSATAVCKTCLLLENKQNL
ncbi:TIGR00269 family protein [Candidatus Woesearchaeota archaeon]|nr:TIGR00269 family protein [Candidatus Woesearchaeota archaeon]